LERADTERAGASLRGYHGPSWPRWFLGSCAVLVLLQELLKPLGGLSQLGDKCEVAHLVLMLPYETHQLELCPAYLWVVSLQVKRLDERLEGLRPAVASVVYRVPLSVSANGFIGTISA
jgi:hypothetical protein